MPGHSLALQCLGTFILWFGWYGFNSGSTLSVTTTGSYETVSHTAINTTLSAAAGCVMSLFLSTIVEEYFTGEITFNLQYTMNGCLSGLVAVTGGCAVVESWASILIGLVAGGLYLGCSKLLVKMRIDDAVDAIPVHLVSGMWGCISVGLFAEPSLMKLVYNSDAHVGWFYSWGRGSADAVLLGCQVVGILFVFGWVLGTMAPFFWMLHYFGYLRADSLEEVVGLDIGYTGGAKPKSKDALQLDEQMDDFLREYEHRKREKAYLKKNKMKASPIPASSVHQESLHGNSYHGRRIITPNMIESLDTTSGGTNGIGSGASVAPQDQAEVNGDISESAGAPERAV
jgi:Amt family ammonium transporter